MSRPAVKWQQCKPHHIVTWIHMNSTDDAEKVKMFLNLVQSLFYTAAVHRIQNTYQEYLFNQ